MRILTAGSNESITSGGFRRLSTKDVDRSAQSVPSWSLRDLVLNAAARVVTGTRKFDRGLGHILHDEAWRHRSGVIQAGSDSSPVSERPRSTVPVGLLCSSRRCWHSATAAFQQPSTSCSATLPAQYLWLPGFFSCRAMPAPQSGTLSRILSGTRPSVQTVSDVCLRCISVCSILVHSAR